MLEKIRKLKIKILKAYLQISLNTIEITKFEKSVVFGKCLLGILLVKLF